MTLATNLVVENDAHPPAVESSRATSTTQIYIPSLDGIRAVSVTLVFLGHAGLKLSPAGLGVTIFFFLSGYLITTLMRIEVANFGGINIRAFYLRRILRILPPFYAALLFAVSLHLFGVFKAPLKLEPLICQLFQVTNYWIIYNSAEGMAFGTGVFWSLAVEEHFYLIFPLLFGLIRVRFNVRWQTSLLIAICIAILLWRCVLIYYFRCPVDVVHATRTNFATDTRTDSILWGCILAISCNPVMDKPFAQGKPLAATLALAIGVMLFCLLYGDGGFRETFRYSLQGIALIPIFTAAIVWHQQPLFRWLNWRSVRRLGVLSYSFYLIHYTILYLTKELWNDDNGANQDLLSKFIQGLAAFAISLCLAEIFYRLIETPCAQLRKRLLHRKS